CLLFSGGQMSNFMWGFQTQVGLLYFFSLLAFCFVGTAIESQQRGPYLAACIFAICACLSQSGGLLVFPVILLITAWHWPRTGRTVPVVIVIVAALMGVFQLWGPGWSPPSSVAFGSIGDQALFALSFLGSPLAAIAPALVIPAGVIAIALSAVLIIHYVRIAAPRLDETIAVAICLLVPALALAAALTR